MASTFRRFARAHPQLLLVLLGAACGDSAAPSPPPRRDLERDVLDVGLEVDLSARQATASITLAPAQSTGASFEVGDLEIRRVSDPRGPLEFERDGSYLDVGVRASTDAPVELSIEYEYREHDDSAGAARQYTMLWPYHCGNLFPCRSAPADGLTFSLQLAGVPSGTTVVYPVRVDAPGPPYMLAWAVGDYLRLDLGTTAAGTRVSARYLPRHRAAAEEGTRHLRDVFDWYESNLGPYPYGSEVASVEVEWGPGVVGGLEHHPFWHISSQIFASYEAHAHEAAHGWFGNGVRLACWEDFVLSEGTASYLAAHALGAVAGAPVGEGLWRSYEQRLAALEERGQSAPAWPAGCGQVDVLGDGLFSDAPYVSGALFLRALEQRVGAAALIEALARFYAEFAGSAAGMQDLLDVIGEETGYDPDYCAVLWLQSVVTPAFEPCP